MKRTTREIAEYLGASLEGDPNLFISGVSGPKNAGLEDLIYVESNRYLGRAERSRARAALVGETVHLSEKALLRLANPKLAFAKAAALLLSDSPIAEGIHPTAVISPAARLGEAVAVGPFTVIEDEVEIGSGTQVGAFGFLGRGSRIGERCRLFPRVTLYAGVRLGSGVIVHSGVVIGSDGFGYVAGEDRQWKFPQIGKVEIGDDVEIGSNTTIDRGSLADTRIATGVKIDNLVQVAHNVTLGEHTVIAAQTGISGSSAIGSRVLIGGQVGIGERCHIEDGAILAAQAGIVTGKTIHSGQTVWGTPARPLSKFKQQYAWFARIAELAERIKKLEGSSTDR